MAGLSTVQAPGLMTMAGFEKTGYYRRQSLWSSIPMIHLATIAAEDSCRTSWGETSKQPIDCEFAPVSECWIMYKMKKWLLNVIRICHRLNCFKWQDAWYL